MKLSQQTTLVPYKAILSLNNIINMKYQNYVALEELRWPKTFYQYPTGRTLFPVEFNEGKLLNQCWILQFSNSLNVVFHFLILQLTQVHIIIDKLTQICNRDIDHSLFCQDFMFILRLHLFILSFKYLALMILSLLHLSDEKGHGYCHTVNRSSLSMF